MLLLLLLLLLCEILLLRIWYHHGLLAVYGKKEIRHVLHVCHMICNNRGFPVGDAAVSVLSVRLSFLIQEWDTNDIENKFNYLVVCNFGPGLAQRTNPTFSLWSEFPVSAVFYSSCE